LELINSLIEYLDCGQTKLDYRGTAVSFRVRKFSDIVVKIIPFFDKHPLHGTKALDYAVPGGLPKLPISKVKGHLTEEGLEEILHIKPLRIPPPVTWGGVVFFFFKAKQVVGPPWNGGGPQPFCTFFIKPLSLRRAYEGWAISYGLVFYFYYTNN